MVELPFKWNIAFILIAFAIAGLLGHCQKKQEQLVAQKTAPILTEKENEKIVFDSSHGAISVTRITRKAGHKGNEANQDSQTISNLGEARRATVTVEKDGTIQVWTQTKGFCFSPGVGLVLSERPRLSFDAEFAFFRRYGLNAGFTVSRLGRPRLFVGGSYNVYSNSSLLVGIDSRKDIVVGLRVAF